MNIFQIAKALGADDLTSPTIPFNGPFGNTTPMPTGTGGPSIILQTNVVTLKKGEQAKVEVVIFTNHLEVKGFKFKIKFGGQSGDCPNQPIFSDSLISKSLFSL